MSRLPPELISLDNQIEDFWAEYRRKTTRIVTAEEIPEGHYWEPVAPAPEPKPRWTWKTVALLVLAFALAVVCYALIAAEMSK